MPEAVTLDERYVRLACDLADRAGEERPNRRARPGPPAVGMQYARHFGSRGGRCGARVDLGDHQMDRVREQPRTQTGPPPRTSTEPGHLGRQ